MKRFFAAAVVLLGAIIVLGAAPATLDETIDLSATLRSLDDILRAEQFDRLPWDRAVILSGAIASIDHLVPDEDEFQVLLELVDGEWLNLSEIRTYRAYIVASGSEYLPRFPVRLPRDPGPEVILANQRVLVVGWIVDVWEDFDGSLAVVVDAANIRRIR
ncbi:MAG: hypothetical protein EA426_01290 [Spirochaetaceae bacterium]|nr:MAG: hypothetical protein EA426_01290 [Spirochaetaceae bacterium]